MSRGYPVVFEELDRKERDLSQCGNCCRIYPEVMNVGIVNGIELRLVTKNPQSKRLEIRRFYGNDPLSETSPYFGNGFVVLKFQSCYFRK